MAELKAVIFDYYETLVALSTEPRERMFDALARRVGVNLAPGEAFRHWRELTTKDALIRFGSAERPPLDGPTAPFRSFEDVWRHRSDELFRHWGVDTPGAVGAEAYAEAHAAAPLYPEVAAALDPLRERFIVAVLSDADDGFLRENVRRNGLAFDAVVSSEELRAYKPHVTLFHETCARLGVEPSEAAYVGDSPWADIEGARHAGLRAVWINRHEHVWPEDVVEAAATVTSLTEVAVQLEGTA